ncbi:MAG: helix-turn-helix transcriptional regulator [Oscillospiraceae bacterium]
MEVTKCTSTIKHTGSGSKRLRTGRELTQEQLAEKINVSRTYIVKIENGLQIGPIEIAIELAMFFDVSMDFLLLGKENYRVDRKQCLRMAIDILSELEAEL